MKQRNPLAVFFLPFITFGIYGLVWQVKTKHEMQASVGAEIPTSWLLIVPIVNLLWYWKYSAGVDKVTNGKLSQVLAFVLLILLGSIGAAIIQSEFNKAGSAPVAASVAPSVPAPDAVMPAAPVMPETVAPAAPITPEAVAPVIAPEAPVAPEATVMPAAPEVAAAPAPDVTPPTNPMPPATPPVV